MRELNSLVTQTRTCGHASDSALLCVTTGPETTAVGLQLRRSQPQWRKSSRSEGPIFIFWCPESDVSYEPICKNRADLLDCHILARLQMFESLSLNLRASKSASRTTSVPSTSSPKINQIVPDRVLQHAIQALAPSCHASHHPQMRMSRPASAAVSPGKTQICCEKAGGQISNRRRL